MFVNTSAADLTRRRGWRCLEAVAVVVALLLVAAVQGTGAHDECSFPSAGVSVTVSPIRIKHGRGQPTTRSMEVFWWGMTSPKSDDWLGIWSHDPLENINGQLDSIAFSSQRVRGHLKFSVEFNSSTIPSDVREIHGNTCLPYWVGYVQDDELLYSACLKIQPHWMHNMSDTLNDVAITDILIPGIHDGGSATYYQDWAHDGIVDRIVAEWTFTQDDSLWHQLVMGIRYLDIRIGYYPDKEHVYYLVHNFVFVAPLYLYLEDVAKFMNQTNEIVIFDIHSLEHDFNDPRAEPGLVALLELYFEKWMVSDLYAPNPSLGSLWNTTDKRLIITYPGIAPNTLFWQSVTQVFSNTQHLEDLISYYDESIPEMEGNDSLWASMLEFTPTVVDVITNHWKGLTGAAAITNFPVSMRLKRSWWTQANIIAMDFSLGSDVIDTTIEGNKLKFTCLPVLDETYAFFKISWTY